jgi:hypothetical protein
VAGFFVGNQMVEAFLWVLVVLAALGGIGILMVNIK